MAEKEYKTIATPSFLAFCYELQEHVKVGFKIDNNNEPAHWGTLFECGMVRDDLSAKALTDILESRIAEKPVLDRKAIMNHARAQKGKSKEIVEQPVE